MTTLNGRLTGTLNYYSPNKLFIIENCGDGTSTKIRVLQVNSIVFCLLPGCHVLKQSDHIGNEGEVIGLDLPIQDYFMANDSDELLLEGNIVEKK